MHGAHPVASVAEHQRARGLEKAQHVDHGQFDFVRRDADSAVFNVAVRLVAAHGVDAQGVALIALGQGRDVLGDRCREQQRAAVDRRGVEDLFQVFAEAHVEHLVGLVEDEDTQCAEVEVAALQMVFQSARRADQDVAAGGQGALLTTRIHAADAGLDLRPSLSVKPAELASDLHGQFTGGGDGQRQRRARLTEPLLLAQQGRAGRQTEGHRLARPGLGRHQQVAALGFLRQDGRLYGGGFFVSLARERARQGGMDVGEGHGRP